MGSPKGTKPTCEAVQGLFLQWMEDELDQIMAGEEIWQDVVKNFYGPFYEQLTKALDEKCPKCATIRSHREKAGFATKMPPLNRACRGRSFAREGAGCLEI